MSHLEPPDERPEPTLTIKVRRVDVRWHLAVGVAERVTAAVAEGPRRDMVRPLYCPRCGYHYTARLLPSSPVAGTVVHYPCATCGGDGTPATLEAPR